MSTDTRSSAIRTGRLAGALYLLMMPFAIFTLYVRSEAMVADDPAATAAHLVASPGLYRAAIVTWLTSQVISIFLVVQLYRLLAPVNATHALMMLVLALVGVPIVFANESHQFAALMLLQDPAQLMMHLRLHERGLALAQVFWGMWLLPLGWLVYQSTFLPRWLGVLLLIGGCGYLIDFFTAAGVVSEGFTVTQFTFIGELLLPLWLLIKGVNVERWLAYAAKP